MTGHVHYHGYSWDVTEDKEQIGAQQEELIGKCIKCLHAMLKTHKFFKSRPRKGIKVLGLIWTWYCTKVKFIAVVPVTLVH